MNFNDARHRVAQLLYAGRISHDEALRRHTAICDREAAWQGKERRPTPRPRRADRPAPEPSPHYAQSSAQLNADARLNYTTIRLILKLKELARGRAHVTAYVDQLADLLGVSGRQIQRAQARAELCGYILIHRERQGRKNLANRYGLLPPCFPQGRQGKKGTPRRQPGDARRRRSGRLESLHHGVTNRAPHEEASSMLPPSPPSGGTVERGGLPTATISALPAKAQAETGASKGGAQVPCHQIDLEEAIAAKAQAPP